MWNLPLTTFEAGVQLKHLSRAGGKMQRKIRITLSLTLILTLTPENSSTVYPLQHPHNHNLHFTIDCRPVYVTPSSSPGSYKTPNGTTTPVFIEICRKLLKTYRKLGNNYCRIYG